MTFEIRFTAAPDQAVMYVVGQNTSENGADAATGMGGRDTEVPGVDATVTLLSGTELHRPTLSEKHRPTLSEQHRCGLGESLPEAARATGSSLARGSGTFMSRERCCGV